MQTDFPDDFGKYIKASDFQDTDVTLTFLGWEKKANEDDPNTKKNPRTWKQKIKYVLRYSYPEIAVDEAGDQILNEDGEPFTNRYYDPAFPKGYTIVYHFEQGDLESGSLPLFRAFCKVKPKPGESVIISRTGENKETKWSVKRVEHHPGAGKIQISQDEMEPDSDVPF